MEPVVPAVAVGVSLVKGDRTEWAVAKLAELGVDRIIPLICARTVVRPAVEDADRRLERLRRIARESAMQARLVFLPEVSPLVDLGHDAVEGAGPRLAVGALACGRGPAEPGLVGIALAEPGGGKLSSETTCLLVGPEGGWAPAELDLGLPTVSLGDSILRVETAAVVAGALLTALRAGRVNPPVR